MSSNEKTKEEIKKEMQRERIKKFKENPRTKWVASNLSKVFNVTNLLLLGTLILTFIFQWDLFLLIILLGAIIFILTLIFKDLSDDKTKAKIPFRFKTGLTLLVTNLIAYVFASGFKDVFPKGLLMGITFIAMFVVIIMMPVLFKKPKFQESFEKMMEKNIFDEMLGEEIKDGDAILGVDLETGKPVVLPYADRFLHMLALGATGTGKTAMTLTPMAFRDINNPNMGFTVIEPKGN